MICFAPTLALAKKLIRSGVDALVIEGMEAGGHIGPVSTSVLAQEMLPEIAEQVPVFVAGGIGRGEAIAGYLDMGAAGVQLGTRFVCATECIAHANFKKAFIRASRARRGGQRPDRPAAAGHPGARAEECGGRTVQREAARGRAGARRGSGRDGSRRSCRSNIIGRARCAAR